jgi:xanthine dehydrogenase accessory factor
VKLETLAELNAERAARRPAIVITDTADGAQRLVKAKDFAADPLRNELSAQLRMGKSGMVEVGAKKLFLNVYAPTARHHRRGSYQPGAGADGAVLGL